MLARKDEAGTKKAQGAGERPSNDAAYIAAAAAITGATGLHVTSVSEFVSRFVVLKADEAARKRINRMNEKLKELEVQMEVLEAEMSKAKDFYECA